MPLYKVLGRVIAVQEETNGGATIKESYYRSGAIAEITAAVAAPLLTEGEVEAYAGALPADAPYDTQLYPNPNAGSTLTEQYPRDAAGFLYNNGDGVLTWVDGAGGGSGNTSVLTDNGNGTYTHDDGTGNTVTISGGGNRVMETLTITSVNTSNPLSQTPNGPVAFFVNGVETAAITNSGTAVSIDAAALGYSVDATDIVRAHYVA